MRIAISPDEDPGQSGTTADPSVTERELNVRVAEALQAELGRCKQDAWFNPNIGVVQRVAEANGDGTELLIACAHNAGGGEGTVFVFCPGGEQSGKQAAYADAVQAELVNAGITAGGEHRYDENVYECCGFGRDTLYCELLFMDSGHDRAIYHAPDYPAKAAAAIARGVSKVAGFEYVPAAPPSPPAPPPAPEWLANLEPDPQTFELARPVALYDLATGAQFDMVPEGPLSTGYRTTVAGTEYLVTEYSKAHELPHGLKAADVQAAEPPAPAPQPPPPPPTPEPPPPPAPPPAPVPAPPPAPEPPPPPAPPSGGGPFVPPFLVEAAKFLEELAPVLEPELAAEAKRILALLEGKG